jgi:TAG lipase/steryl ester hydrolase/phospholipase A2/LPA acyltransferase
MDRSKVSNNLIDAVRHSVMYILDITFLPKELLKTVFMIVGLQSALLTLNYVYSKTSVWISLLTSRGRKRKQIEDDLSNADSYVDWESNAKLLDEFDGKLEWIQDENSNFYNPKVLRKRIHDIKDMMERGDIFNLMFKLRGGLSRDAFNSTNESLFLYAKSGTKNIIFEYNDIVCQALNFICNCESLLDNVPTDAKLAFFNETRHSFGRTALLLSGGAALGYYHIGVVRTLYLEGLLPRVISGASAGSLMTAILGTKTGEEMIKLIDSGDFRRDFFSFPWQKENITPAQFQYYVPPPLRWFTDLLFKMTRSKKSLYKLDTEHLKEVVRINVGDYTFQEAFDRTGRIINIMVAPTNKFDPPKLLNYLTAPHVCVWSAAVASCAIPGVFDAIALVIKEPNGQIISENHWVRNDSSSVHLNMLGDDNQNTGHKHQGSSQITERYSDGSVENDLPMQQLSELFNINHFIISQVNPHSFLLATLSIQSYVWTNKLVIYTIGYLKYLKAQCRTWLKNVLNLLSLKIFYSSSNWGGRRTYTQILTQEYEGRDVDVSIMPWRGTLSILQAFLSLIKNPTLEEYKEILKVSTKSTFPYIPRIRGTCAVEVTLDKCVQILRQRLVLEERNKIVIQSGSRKTNKSPLVFTSRSIVNLSGLSVTDQTVRNSLVLSSKDSLNDLLYSGVENSLSKNNDVVADSDVEICPVTMADFYYASASDK